MSEEDKENKKVLIKINVSKKADFDQNQVVPKIETKWNYIRIAEAILLMIILLVGGIYIFKDGDRPQVKNIKDVKTDIKLPASQNTESNVLAEKNFEDISIQSDHKQTDTNNLALNHSEVINAQLAKGIWKDDPFGIITESIKVNNEKATGIFYFTELKNMKGKTVFHIWKFEDEIIFKKRKDVLENQWKTYSSKLFTKRSVGFWSVETVDSNHQQLNVINFDVVAE